MSASMGATHSMGAEHSTDTTQEIIEVQNRMLEEMRRREEESLRRIAQLSTPASDLDWVSWDPAPLRSFYVTGQREDGSVYKELYVPKWSVVFFDDNGALGIREQRESLNGRLVSVYEAHAILLHNAYMKWAEYRKAARIGLVALNRYVVDGSGSKL